MTNAIKIGESYTIADFKRQTGLGQNAIRQAERDGLICCWVGVRKYITGQSWMNFLAKQSSKKPPNRGQRQ